MVEKAVSRGKSSWYLVINQILAAEQIVRVKDKVWLAERDVRRTEMSDGQRHQTDRDARRPEMPDGQRRPTDSPRQIDKPEPTCKTYTRIKQPEQTQ